MTQRRCPTCKKLFDPQASRSLPFCSQRCREVDLGRWLNEEMTLPVELGGDAEPDCEDAQADDTGD